MAPEDNPADDDEHGECRYEIERLKSEVIEPLEADVQRFKDFGVVMARACGNWREWPGSPSGDDHEHPDWKAAARAFLERDDLRATLEELLRAVQGSCGLDGRDGSRAIQEWFKKHYVAVRDISVCDPRREGEAGPDDRLGKQTEYSIALQRAIEFHCNGMAVPAEIYVNCPHHAAMLNKRHDERGATRGTGMSRFDYHLLHKIVGCVIRSLKRLKHERGDEPGPLDGVLWGRVSNVMGLGSTSSIELCREFGEDPEFK